MHLQLLARESQSLHPAKPSAVKPYGYIKQMLSMELEAPGLVSFGKVCRQYYTIDPSNIKAGLQGNKPTSGHGKEGC